MIRDFAVLFRVNSFVSLHAVIHSKRHPRKDIMRAMNCFRVGFFAAFAAGVLSFFGQQAESAERPNILLILADDMGFGDVHALNPQSKIPTPNLDRLADEGMAFLDAHTPSGVCTPTRYGLLTGRYCWRSKLKRGVLGGYSPPLIEASRRTIATVLKSVGYRTSVVGKWHLGMGMPLLSKDADTSKWQNDPGIDWDGKIQDGPTARGFDDCFCVSASLDMAPYVYIRNDGFAAKPTTQQPALKFPDFVRAGPRSKDFVIDQVLDRLADEAIARITDGAKADKPFFLYFPLTAPHKPTTPHARFKGKTKLGPYGDFMVQVDATIGRVLDKLDELKIADNTLVVFTSDNGSYMYRYDEPGKADHVDDSKIQGFRPEHHRANGPWRGTKADIWEGGHHVPFFVRWPGHVKSGARANGEVCLTDVLATCAAITGAKLKKGDAEDSQSFADTLLSKPSPRTVPVIHHSSGGMFAIRSGRWKLILGNGSGGRQAPKGKPFGKPYQLYDILADPSEEHDVASGNEETVARLTAEFEEIRGDD